MVKAIDFLFSTIVLKPFFVVKYTCILGSCIIIASSDIKITITFGMSIQN